MDISQTLQELEERLLLREVRQNAREVGRILGDEFREFGSSGQVFSKSEIIELLQSGPTAKSSLQSFQAFSLAEHVALVTYHAVKETIGSEPSESFARDAGRWFSTKPRKSLNSSNRHQT
jgi:hypothetical protein